MRRQRIDAVVGELAEALAGEREIDIGGRDAADVDGVDIVGAVPDERLDRVLVGVVDILEVDDIAAGLAGISGDVEIEGAALLGEEAEARADVVREAVVVIGREDVARRVGQVDERVERARGRRVEVGRVVGAAGHLERVEMALFQHDLVAVEVAGEQRIDRRLVDAAGFAEAEGRAEAHDHGGGVGVADGVDALDANVDGIAAEIRSARIGEGRGDDRVIAGRGRGVGGDRIEVVAAVVVGHGGDDRAAGVAHLKEAVVDRSGAGAAQRDQIGLAGDQEDGDVVGVAVEIDIAGDRAADGDVQSAFVGDFGIDQDRAVVRADAVAAAVEEVGQQFLARRAGEAELRVQAFDLQAVEGDAVGVGRGAGEGSRGEGRRVARGRGRAGLKGRDLASADKVGDVGRGARGLALEQFGHINPLPVDGCEVIRFFRNPKK